MKLWRSLLALPLLPLLAIGCAETTTVQPSSPAQPAALAPAAPAPVTEVNLDPPAAPSARPATGPVTNPDPKVDRKRALEDAKDLGMIALLNSVGDPDAPTTPRGKEDKLGNDPLLARRNVWGEEIGDSFGVGGLGLTGTGVGGGDRGEGTIGLGGIGTIGRGGGGGTGQGLGSGSGRMGGAARNQPPSLKMGATSVSGRLPPEIIQRVVRQNFGRFRYCYEKGLQVTPTLAGKVSIRFVIGADGATSSVSNAGSDLPNKEVVACVVKAFSTLSYPKPEGGVVVVVYPLVFSPGDTTAPAKPPPATPAAAPKAPPTAPKAPAKQVEVDPDTP